MSKSCCGASSQPGGAQPLNQLWHRPGRGPGGKGISGTHCLRKFNGLNLGHRVSDETTAQPGGLQLSGQFHALDARDRALPPIRELRAVEKRWGGSVGLSHWLSCGHGRKKARAGDERKAKSHKLPILTKFL
jgi:hypothetical protein